MSAAVVYRFYDANCHLLYVGRSAQIGVRLASHQSRSRWFDEVDTITVEHFETAEAAEEAERQAIGAERPKFNVQHHPTNRAVVRSGRRRSVDESTWPTTGLVANCLDWWWGDRPLADLAAASVLDAEWVERLARGEISTTIEEASRVAKACGVSVAAIFPNRDPRFVFTDGRFVAAKRLAA